MSHNWRSCERTQHVLQRDVIELRQVLRLQLLRLRQLVAHGVRVRVVP